MVHKADRPPERAAWIDKTKDVTLDATLRTSTKTILLVDGEDILLEVGGQMLQELGYKVLLARGGYAALEIFEKEKDAIDLIILEMVMQDMNGDEVYDRMKAIKPDFDVLLASNLSLNKQTQKILRRGFNGFLQKPFNMRQLDQKIREIMLKNYL